MSNGSLSGKSIVGKVLDLPLSSVKPNSWNPNRMTPTVYRSLKHAMETDGWLSSQALLIWHTDEAGRIQNVIIDGEHRWTVAKECGFASGPMVMLEGMTESKAKALTVAMNNRRGQFDDALLTDLIKSLDGLDDLSLELAIPEDSLAKMFAAEPVEFSLGEDLPAPKAKTEEAAGSSAGGVPAASVPMSSVRMVNLFFTAATVDEFHKLVADLAKTYNTTSATDTVLEALRRAVKP